METQWRLRGCDAAVDLAALDNFLASDRAPSECMQLSELDGFLASIVAGPEPIPPSVWLPIVWRLDEGPVFADLPQAEAILGSVMRRYNEIIHLLDLSPGTYRPVLAELDDGTPDASDWAVGFIQAMALCQEAWTPLAADPAAGALMVPIVLVASTTDMANLHLDEDEKLPEDEMAQLLAEAGPMLSLCVTGIRAFFRQRHKPSRRKTAGRKKHQHR